MNSRPLLFATAGSLLLCSLLGCFVSPQPEVVVYCALDREFAEQILADFADSSGVRVLANYDIESTKTVGLTNKIIQEQSRPRCDLFWNNEILHTIRLQEQGLLQPYQPPGAADFPSAYRDLNGYWYGFAARARVLIVNTELVKEEDWPTSVNDLINPRWQGKVGMAKPLFGTTATHAAVLFATRGDADATEFFQKFKANDGRILSGNKQVAEAVASGQLAFGITDTDDAILERDAARPVQIIFPDQGDDQPGTLLIPNTLCLPRGAANSPSAEKLTAYLLTAGAEDFLARGASAQIPLHPRATVRPRVLPDKTPRWMEVDFPAAAKKWNISQQVLTELFTGP